MNGRMILINMNKQRLLQIALAMIVALSNARAIASSEMDHDKARRALESGQILPLRAILEKIELQYPGQVLEIELEEKHQHWIYELKILQPAGKLIKLKVDASNATILKQK